MNNLQKKQMSVPMETYGTNGKVDLIDIHQNCGFAIQSRVQHPQSKLKRSFKS